MADSKLTNNTEHVTQKQTLGPRPQRCVRKHFPLISSLSQWKIQLFITGCAQGRTYELVGIIYYTFNFDLLLNIIIFQIIFYFNNLKRHHHIPLLCGYNTAPLVWQSNSSDFKMINFSELTHFYLIGPL